MGGGVSVGQSHSDLQIIFKCRGQNKRTSVVTKGKLQALGLITSFLQLLL